MLAELGPGGGQLRRRYHEHSLSNGEVQISLFRMTNTEYMLHKSLRESLQSCKVRQKIFPLLAAFVFSPASISEIMRLADPLL
jgi:hypothetical protein